MAMPLVSVVLIAHNHEIYIEKAIESILMQKVEAPYEIIIHDDASTDMTANIVRNYAKIYPNLIVPIIQNESKYAKEKGICAKYMFPKCRGKFIALCEGDDYWTDPCKLQKQVDYLEQHPECSLCYHDVKVIYDNDRTIGAFCDVKRNFQYDLESLISLINSHCIPTCSVMFRGSYAKYISGVFIDNAPIGDWAIYIIMAQRGLIGYIDEIMAMYRVQCKGIWSAKTDTNKRLTYIEFYKLANAHLEYKYSRILARKISYQYYKIAECLKAKGKRGASIRYMCQALASCPINPIMPYRDYFATALWALSPRLYDAAKSISKKIT